MKLQTLTVRYNAKRTCEFQSAEVGAEMMVQIEEGDKICEVFRAGLKKLAPLVDREADAAIRDLCNASRDMKQNS